MAQDGTRSLAGIWGRVNGKSLVWYPKAEFDAAGYKVPTTWDELMALTDQIVSRWRHPLVYRDRIRRSHRLGDDRLDRRDHAAHHLAGELRQVGGGRVEVRFT